MPRGTTSKYYQHFHLLGLPVCPLRRAARVKKKMSDTRRRAYERAGMWCTAPCWHAELASRLYAAQTDAAGATPGVRLDPTVRTARTAAPPADRPMAEHRHATTTTTAAAAFTCLTIQALLGLDAAAEAALARESDGGCRHLLRIWRDGLNERRLRASCAQALDRARGCARAPAPAADPALAPPVILALPLALARCVRRRPACTTSPGPEPDPERTPL